MRIKFLRDTEGKCGAQEPVTLRFDPADASIVTVTFTECTSPDPDDDDAPEWLIGRHILACGGGVPGGDIEAERGKRLLTLTLRSPDGSCVLGFPVAELDAFLKETYALVPLDSDITELHIDAAIAEWLGGVR